jgi:hypothetical protein
MNYYFLSLLQPDKNRKRNVVRKYDIYFSSKLSWFNIKPNLIDKIHMKLKEFGIENKEQKEKFKQGLEAGEKIGILKRQYWEQIQGECTSIYERAIIDSNYEEEILNRFHSLQPGDSCYLQYNLKFWNGKVFQHYDEPHLFPHIKEYSSRNIFTLDVEKKISNKELEFHPSFCKISRVKIGKVKYDLFFFCFRQLKINEYLSVIRNLGKFLGPYNIYSSHKMIPNVIDIKQFNIEFLVKKKKVVFVEIL